MKDYTGETFNMVTILTTTNTKNRKVSYQCECGEIKDGCIYDIKRGKIKSCGKCFKNKDEEYRKLKSVNAKKLQMEGKLQIGGDNHETELRPFKYLFKCINNSNRVECDVTLSVLKELWERQNGKCMYSGFELLLPTHKEPLTKHKPWLVASIDRIDSTLPYTKSNIQIISRTMNYAKNKMSHKEMLEFLVAIGGCVGIRTPSSTS